LAGKAINIFCPGPALLPQKEKQWQRQEKTSPTASFNKKCLNVNGLFNRIGVVLLLFNARNFSDAKRH